MEVKSDLRYMARQLQAFLDEVVFSPVMRFP